MIRNYIKTAIRHLQKNKLNAFVNIGGLAMAITCCILIGIYIWHELSYDKFHKNGDQIVRVTWQYNFGDSETKTANTGTKVGPQFQRMFPEVKSFVRLLKMPRTLKYEDKLFEEKNFLYADSAFFSTFSFLLIEGNAETALDGPEKMVITESMAKKYFGRENPIGKAIKVGEAKNFTITGITADAPQNSQIQFDFVGSFETLNASKTEKWNEANYVTFLHLSPNAQTSILQQKIWDYSKVIAKEEMQAEGNQYMRYNLEPFTKVHLFSKLDGFEPNSSIVYIYILAAVAFLILLVAGVNYTNLSTAQSADRSAEIGMRKVMGAGRMQVLKQFLCESLVLTFLAMILALLGSVLLLPFFNHLSGKQLELGMLPQAEFIFALFLLTITVAFTAGAYPALILSNSKVMDILKSGFQFTGSGSLRKSLIIIQFVITIFLIIASIFIQQQLSYIQNKDLGYNNEQILVLPVDSKILESYDDFKKALKNNPGVISVAGAYEPPTHIGWSDGLSAGSNGQAISINALPVDEDIVKTLGLRIIAGTDYNQTDVAQFDTTNNGNNIKYSFMLNEAAVKALGWTPKEAIGKKVVKGREGVVKAVVKDFHFRSFHETINPLAIFLDRRLLGNLLIKINSNNTTATISSIEKVWKQRIQDRPFEYSFLDEKYNSLYNTEVRTAVVFTTFSSLAIVLASLGLFALTAFAIVQRAKEIAIRKILGATVFDILSLVSKDLMVLIIISFTIAIPISILSVNKWLESFAFRIDLQWWVFATAAFITLTVALFAVSSKALTTALSSPNKSLRKV